MSGEEDPAGDVPSDIICPCGPSFSWPADQEDPTPAVLATSVPEVETLEVSADLEEAVAAHLAAAVPEAAGKPGRIVYEE